MAIRLTELVMRWMIREEIDVRLAPDPAVLEAGFPDDRISCRPPANPREIDAWEDRHGYRLPDGLRTWLTLSNGLYRTGPFIHPISAIGPMIPFAQVPEMIVQPESWFELGNPNLQTVCIDLGYRLPGAGNPIFTSGDDAQNSAPRIIARSFNQWFLELLRQGGREYWFDADFEDYGAPWPAHRSHAAGPSLSDRLRPYAERVRPLLLAGADERTIAVHLGLNRPEVELILRYLQHSGDLPPGETVGVGFQPAFRLEGDRKKETQAEDNGHPHG